MWNFIAGVLWLTLPPSAGNQLSLAVLDRSEEVHSSELVDSRTFHNLIFAPHDDVDPKFSTEHVAELCSSNDIDRLFSSQHRPLFCRGGLKRTHQNVAYPIRPYRVSRSVIEFGLINGLGGVILGRYITPVYVLIINGSSRTRVDQFYGEYRSFSASWLQSKLRIGKRNIGPQLSKSGVSGDDVGIVGEANRREEGDCSDPCSEAGTRCPPSGIFGSISRFPLSAKIRITFVLAYSALFAFFRVFDPFGILFFGRRDVLKAVCYGCLGIGLLALYVAVGWSLPG